MFEVLEAVDHRGQRKVRRPQSQNGKYVAGVDDEGIGGDYRSRAAGDICWAVDALVQPDSVKDNGTPVRVPAFRRKFRLAG